MEQHREQEPASAQAENPHKREGLRRVVAAVGHSINGLRASLLYESAFRQEVFLAMILIPLAVLLPVDGVFKLLLIGSVFLVLIVELINSAIEACIDYISLEHHPLAKRGKDMASAAVFISLLNCAIVWIVLIVLAWPKIINWLR